MVNLNTEQSRQERVRRDLSEHLSFKWEAYPGDAVYGGASTGPRTPQRAGSVAPGALETWPYSAEALAEQKCVRELLNQRRELLKQMQIG
jgi:hypothetical protein